MWWAAAKKDRAPIWQANICSEKRAHIFFLSRKTTHPYQLKRVCPLQLYSPRTPCNFVFFLVLARLGNFALRQGACANAAGQSFDHFVSFLRPSSSFSCHFCHKVESFRFLYVSCEKQCCGTKRGNFLVMGFSVLQPVVEREVSMWFPTVKQYWQTLKLK